MMMDRQSFQYDHGGLKRRNNKNSLKKYASLPSVTMLFIGLMIGIVLPKCTTFRNTNPASPDAWTRHDMDMHQSYATAAKAENKVSGFSGGRVKQHPIANPNRHGGEAFGVRTTWGWVQ